MKTYWFICYNRIKPGTEMNAIIDKHPLDWLVDCGELYNDGPYILTFYAEVTKEQFKKYEGFIG